MSRFAIGFRQSLIRFVCICGLTFSLVLGGSLLNEAPLAYGQLPALPPNVTRQFLSPPKGVTQHGEYETAEILSPLDHRTLFEVASPTIFNRNAIPEGKLPVEVRAWEVNDRLWRVLNRTLNSQKAPKVTISRLNNRPILEIYDDQLTRPIRLVTVTEPDADLNGKTLDELAQDWKNILQEEVIRFEALTKWEVLQERFIQTFQILLGLFVASGVIYFLRKGLTRRQQTLEVRYQQQLTTIQATQIEQQSEAITDTESLSAEDVAANKLAALQSYFLATLQQQFSIKRRLDFDKFLKWALFWILIAMWYIGIARIISIIPILMQWTVHIWTTPLFLFLIWFGLSLTNRISHSAIDRFIHTHKISSFLSLGEVQRIALRTTTISTALKGLIQFLLIIIGIVITLSLLSVPTGSIVAGGAIIGFAISFGSQSLIKDLINGSLILMEDQYAVGDVIKIGDQDGLVEHLNLRVTQLRNGEGQLISIPNSTITNVCNLTRLWSRVNFSILVAYDNDPKQVLDVLRQVAQDLYHDPEWAKRLPEPPDVLGIDELSNTGMLVRVWIKTVPMEQWNVGREFRFRVRLAFEANQIRIGGPQWMTSGLATQAKQS